LSYRQRRRRPFAAPGGRRADRSGPAGSAGNDTAQHPPTVAATTIRKRFGRKNLGISCRDSGRPVLGWGRFWGNSPPGSRCCRRGNALHLVRDAPMRISSRLVGATFLSGACLLATAARSQAPGTTRAPARPPVQAKVQPAAAAPAPVQAKAQPAAAAP